MTNPILQSNLAKREGIADYENHFTSYRYRVSEELAIWTASIIFSDLDIRDIVDREICFVGNSANVDGV